jgi:plastocyanin
MRTHHVIAVVAALTLIPAGCGGDEDNPEPAGSGAKAPPSSAPAAGDANTYDASSEPRDATIEIVMKDRAFKPAYVTARVGQTLLFINQDDVVHRVKGNEGQYYASKRLEQGESYRYRLKNDLDRANMNFLCTIHPETMEGGVVLTVR